jgi:hypothetical protein
MQSKYKKLTRRKSSKNSARKSRINKSKKSKTRKTKRAFRKRSQHKRSQHKRSQHKRSQHKRSQHKRSQHKRSHRKYKGGCGGQAWKGGDIGKWPGVSGPHDGNYYEYKGVPSGLYDPPMPSNKQFQNGGGMFNLLPQDLVNVGRSLTGGLEGAYASYNGEPRFDSTYPLPIDQPSMNREIQTQIKYNPLNLDKIHINSGNSVSDI